MNILIVITSLGIGGAERQVCDLADNMAELGCRVTILSLFGDDVVVPKNTSVAIKSLKMQRNIKGLLTGLYQAVAFTKLFKPDVVHSHLFHANIFSRLIRVFRSFPVLINSIHSTYEGGKIRMLAYRYTDFLSDLSTNVSIEAAEALVEKKVTNTDKMITMYNGIDVKKFYSDQQKRTTFRSLLSVPDETVLILAVGRLTEAKDYPNLLHAFASLEKSGQDIQLFIVGEGEAENEIKQLSAQLGLISSVHFLGARVDIPDLMNAADLFVLSSAWEGFGLVVAEAMSCERVVVATDCGGVKEVVSDYGFLVQPRRSDLLSASLRKAIDLNDEEKKRLGQSAREWICGKFSINAIAGEWLSLYRRMIKKSE